MSNRANKHELKLELEILKRHRQLYQSKLILLSKLGGELCGREKNKSILKKHIQKIYGITASEQRATKLEEHIQSLINLKTHANLERNIREQQAAATQIHNKLTNLQKKNKTEKISEAEDIGNEFARLETLVLEEGKLLISQKIEGVVTAYQSCSRLTTVPANEVRLYHAYPGPYNVHVLLSGGILNKFASKRGFFLAENPRIAREASPRVFQSGEKASMLVFTMSEETWRSLLKMSIINKAFIETGECFVVKPTHYFEFNRYLMEGKIRVTAGKLLPM